MKSQIKTKIGTTFFVGDKTDIDLDHLKKCNKVVIVCKNYEEALSRAKKYADKINEQQGSEEKRIVRVPGVRATFAVAETPNQMKEVTRARRQKTA